MSKQLNLALRILKESENYKIGDQVWAKDSIKRYQTHAGYSREAVVKEDTIDELNKSTVDSYKEKATDELKQAKKYSKSEYGDIAKRIMARRTSGLSRVLKRNESEDIKESSMNDLASGKGDGKELKASPEYRRDRRRTAQMLAAQKEVQARVKRGYAEDDKDLDEGILSKVANKVMGAAPKEPKYKVGQVVSYETPEDQPDWKDRGRGKGTITKYSNGHYTVNGNPVNHFDIKKVHESIDEATKGHTIEAQGVRGMKNTPWRRTFKNVDHLNKWAEENDSVEIHGTRDLEQAKKGNLSPAIREDLDEAKLASPLKGHVYHTKSDAELRGIVKDAGETARVQKGMSSEGKYLDQMNDASTVLHYRSKGGKQIIATNPRMAAPKSTEDSIKAKLAKWNKSESSSTQNPLEKATHITKKDIRHSDGGIVPEKTTLRNVEGDKYEIRSGRYKGKIATFHPDNLQKLDEDHIRGAKSGTLEEDLDEDASDAAKFNAKIKQASEASSAGRHTHAKMHLDNARILMIAVKSSDLSKIQDSYKQYRDLRVKYPYKKPVMVESAEKLTEISLQTNIDAHAKRSSEDVVEGSIEEVSTTLLKSYAKKAREDARKLSKQGDAAKTDKTKLAKYVKATKRHLNAHKAEDKISSNEFYGKK